MTTLAIALAQSPIRAAWTHGAEAQSVVEVRALWRERADVDGAPMASLRYELLTTGVPQMVGSYAEITAIAAHLRAPQGGWASLDWQPVYERATQPPVTGNDHTARQAPGVH